MDSDFHYYGTGSAAAEAGFSTREAKKIAFAAQFLDWFNSDFWCNWEIVDTRGRPMKDPDTNQPYFYRQPQLTIQTVDWKLSFDYDPDIWNAFHFPPGNLPHAKVPAKGWKRVFAEQLAIRETGLKQPDAAKLCRPYSAFALALIEDTIKKFRQLIDASSEQVVEYVKKWVGPRHRCPVENGKPLALILLGIRMHVLADTWAHQDFAGERNKHINGIGPRSNVAYKNRSGKFVNRKWTGIPWALNDNTDFAAAPDAELGGDIVSGGHAQLGYFPDFSWLTYKYQPAWLPAEQRTHVRDNPKEYLEAWQWLAFVMRKCLEPSDSRECPEAVPREVKGVISKWQSLNAKRCDSFERKEKAWQATSLGKRVHLEKYQAVHWPALNHAPLGLVGKLASTRFGTIQVKAGDELHMMEIAAAIHYEFCRSWAKKNPGYGWKPERIKD